MADGTAAPTINEFKASIREQLTAIEAAAREFLAKQPEGDEKGPREVRIELRTSLDDPRAPNVTDGMCGVECYTHTYIGGHMLDGAPIYVLETVCIEGVAGMGQT